MIFFSVKYGVANTTEVSIWRSDTVQYGKDTTDEMIANCGVEVVFTPKELDMANEISARLGTYMAQSRSENCGETIGQLPPPTSVARCSCRKS